MSGSEAADPVDTDALRLAGKRADYYQTGEGPLWRAAASDVDRLRAVIENAPHAASCYVAMGVADGPCDCWKADAL